MKVRAGIGLLAGVLFILSSAAHAFTGWPPFRSALGATDLSPDLAGALAVGWYWGSVGMLGFGLVVLSEAYALLRGQPANLWPSRLVGFSTLVFGLAAFTLRDFNSHFLVFVVLGGLTLGFALLRQRP